ncbi:MAG TPA: SPFH domain-containing protein [Planctomycetota bacterium]|nr:SPFH domain-containing protein [Planctomycetota bacterium]
MKLVRTALLVLLVVVVAGALGSGLLLERVEPATIGVRVNQLRGGVVDRDFRTGYHLGVLGVHRWHRLDGRVHFISFESERVGDRGTAGNVDYASSLDIRTSDNNTASLDLTVTYRILSDEGWRIVADGYTLDYRDRVLRSIQGILREELSKLAPEDFFQSDVRLARVEETLPLLREAIAQYHVEPLAILIRAVRFPQDYEAQLQMKQLSRQKALLAQARQREEEQQQVTQSIEKGTEAQEKQKRGEWDKRLQQSRSDNEVAIAQILADAEVYSRTKRADSDATHATLLAEGNLGIAEAEALRDSLRNAALDSTGGRILLARQAAENLQIDQVTLNSNDPSVPTVIDVDALVRLLVGGAAPPASQPD